MTTLKLAFHDTIGRRIVEIYDDNDDMVGCIYPTQDGSNSVHIVSKYFADVPINPSVSMIPVPGFVIQFKAKQ